MFEAISMRSFRWFGTSSFVTGKGNCTTCVVSTWAACFFAVDHPLVSPNPTLSSRTPVLTPTNPEALDSLAFETVNAEPPVVRSNLVATDSAPGSW
jgi:hypothetical protein